MDRIRVFVKTFVIMLDDRVLISRRRYSFTWNMMRSRSEEIREKNVSSGSTDEIAIHKNGIT